MATYYDFDELDYEEESFDDDYDEYGFGGDEGYDVEGEEEAYEADPYANEARLYRRARSYPMRSRVYRRRPLRSSRIRRWPRYRRGGLRKQVNTLEEKINLINLRNILFSLFGFPQIESLTVDDGIGADSGNVISVSQTRYDNRASLIVDAVSYLGLGTSESQGVSGILSKFLGRGGSSIPTILLLVILFGGLGGNGIGFRSSGFDTGSTGFRSYGGGANALPLILILLLVLGND